MSEQDSGPKLSGPMFWDVVRRLGNAGPQWRPEADKVEAELTDLHAETLSASAFKRCWELCKRVRY